MSGRPAQPLLLRGAELHDAVRNLLHRRVVEDDRGGQLHVQVLLEPRAEGHGRQAVHAAVHQRIVGEDLVLDTDGGLGHLLHRPQHVLRAQAAGLQDLDRHAGRRRGRRVLRPGGRRRRRHGRAQYRLDRRDALAPLDLLDELLRVVGDRLRASLFGQFEGLDGRVQGLLGVHAGDVELCEEHHRRRLRGLLADAAKEVDGLARRLHGLAEPGVVKLHLDEL
mmetsp:Transcript_5214/g.15378  ORF Transcript_5214/g.15378 Transcript_5214/m.15378 type:complete len:222 (-) Transcript_5214:973-1638(-)